LTEDGKDWLVHHFYDANRMGARTLQIRPLLWDDDGWPLPGEPISQSQPTAKATGKIQIAGTWEVSVNFGTAEWLTLSANGRIGQGPGAWQVKDTRLSLRWPRGDGQDEEQVERGILALDGRWFVGRNAKGHVVRGKRVGEE
jgi:hypothetical protein